MAWVAEQSLVLQGSEDLRLRLWDPRTLSKPVATMEGYVYFPLACAAAGDLLLTGSNGFDGEGCELRVWDRRMLRQLSLLQGHQQAVCGVALLPATADAPTVSAVSGSKDGELRLWDLGSGECAAQHSLSRGGVSAVGAALADEDAHLYVGSTLGEVHAFRAGGANGFTKVATGEARMNE